MHRLVTFLFVAFMGVGLFAPSAPADDTGDCAAGSRRIAACSRLITRNPKDAGAFIYRGQAYQDPRDDDRAIAGYTEAIRLDPDTLASVSRALAYEHKDDFDHAIADYTKTVRLGPKYTVVALTNRGRAYEHKRDLDPVEFPDRPPVALTRLGAIFELDKPRCIPHAMRKKTVARTAA